MIYGYCRVSSKGQQIQRQISNILREYPSASIFQETFTGRSLQRPEFTKLMKIVKKGDCIVFDEVSRMSRDAEDGVKLYEKLYNMGIDLVFIKEPHINTSVYRSALENSVQLTGNSVDFIIEGINKYLIALAREQIFLAFSQSEKEVNFLRQRTKEGLRQAKLNGVQLGHTIGTTYETKKSKSAKETIKRHAKCFGGNLGIDEILKLCDISRGSYFKYRNELLSEQTA